MTTAEISAGTKVGLQGNLDRAAGFIEIAEVDVPGAGFP
jgi:hypothetical protein